MAKQALKLVKTEPVAVSTGEIIRLLRSPGRVEQNEGISLFYADFARAVLAAALSVTGNQDDAEDVMMEVVETLPETIKKYDERGTFAGWVWKLTRNKALESLRKYRPRAGPFVRSATDPDDSRVLSRIVVLALLDQLDDDDRDVIVMRDLLDRDYESVAHELGVNEDAVRQRYSRAMKRLRRIAYTE